jgi:hypothetical protein
VQDRNSFDSRFLNDMPNRIQNLLIIFSALYSLNALAAPAYEDQVPMIQIDTLFLDPAMTAEEQEFVKKSVAQARTNIIAVYGEQKAEMPDIIWCKTKACVLYFSGTDGRSFSPRGNGYRKEGAQYKFWKPAIVFTRMARVRDPEKIRAVETLTHELSHTEFHARLGNATVPAWFNEGVATYVGKEHACEEGVRGVERLADLDTGAKWISHTNRDAQTLLKTYCQASAEVGAWIERHGGFTAVIELLTKRARLASFESLYGPLITDIAGQ